MKTFLTFFGHKNLVDDRWMVGKINVALFSFSPSSFFWAIKFSVDLPKAKNNYKITWTFPNILNTRQVSSMIHSAILTVSPVATIVLLWFCFAISGDGRTDNMCENIDPYWPWLWVNRVEQKQFASSKFQLLQNKIVSFMWNSQWNHIQENEYNKI